MKLKNVPHQRGQYPIEKYTSLTYDAIERLEWDENKQAINIQKHGIDFIKALDIFADTKRIEEETIS